MVTPLCVGAYADAFAFISAISFFFAYSPQNLNSDSVTHVVMLVVKVRLPCAAVYYYFTFERFKEKQKLR